MRFVRLLPVIVPVLALVVCAGGISKADDDPISGVGISYPLDSELLIHLHNQNGVIRHTVIMPNGSAIVFSRNIANTLPWSVQSDADVEHAYYDVLASEATLPSELVLCCTFDCDGGYYSSYDFFWNDCVEGGQGCEICTLLCREMTSCPVGTKKHIAISG